MKMNVFSISVIMYYLSLVQSSSRPFLGTSKRKRRNLYKKFDMMQENIRLMRARVSMQYSTRSGQIHHHQSGKQMTIPNDISLPFCCHASVTSKSYKMKCDLRRGEWN